MLKSINANLKIIKNLPDYLFYAIRRKNGDLMSIILKEKIVSKNAKF